MSYEYKNGKWAENVQLTGSKGEKASLVSSLPISVAAGEYKAVATLTQLPSSGVKRVTVAFRWDASIPHQFYVNHEDENGVSVGSTLTGSQTKTNDVKETIVYAEGLKFIANNGDTVTRNLNNLNVIKWGN
jgi:hypothetical protein